MLQINLTVFPVLETARLILRQLEYRDESQIYLLRSDEQVNSFIDRPRSTSAAEAAAFIKKIISAIAENKSLYWAITKKGSDDLIGTICIWNIDPINYVAEVGYELMPDHQGKGIMKEALIKVIEYCFLVINLKRINAHVHPGNERSIVLLERSGFIKLPLNKSIEGNEILFGLENDRLNH